MNYDDADAADQLGLALLQLGKLDEAVAAFRRAAEYNPKSLSARLNLGKTLLKQGKHKDAVTVFEDALALSADNPEALFGLGNALKATGRTQDALKALERGLASRPDHGEGLFEKGALLRDLKRVDEAEAALRAALAAQPDHREAGLALAKILHEARRFGEAVPVLERITEAHPDHVAGWVDLGSVFLGDRNYPRALDAYRRALGIEPASAAVLCNMSLALFGMGRTEEGIEACRTALAVEPASATAQFNMACMYLSLGRFREGWEAYEFRFPMGNNKAMREDIRAAPWRGEDLSSKSILVLGEQANGDYLHFSRYASALADLGAEVHFSVLPRLKRLLGSLPNAVTLLSETKSGMPFDFQCHMMSLPLRFERLGLPLPTSPYLSAEPELAEKWRARIGDHGFRIATAWQGTTYGGTETRRAFKLQHLKPLAAVPGVRLISIQMGEGIEQIEKLRGMTVDTLGPDFDSGEDAFVDTAAVIANVDLVVTCDTSIAHLAGAMGKPVWIALIASPEWRWQRDRKDSVWYPSARLFRQATDGDWDGVFREMADALRERVSRPDSGKLPPRAGQAPAPRVPVSWGECIDKITILEIKSKKISSPDALANIERELGELRHVLSSISPLSPEIEREWHKLRRVNEALWDIEDDIRDLEARRQFDGRFIELSRSVYQTNDERSRIKKEINLLTNSAIVEEKQYAKYGPDTAEDRTPT